MSKRFHNLETPHQWKSYWTKYPHGFTIYEALIDWVSKVNEMVTNVNDWNEYLDDFVDNFEFELQEEVQKIITEWQNEGILEDIINSALTTGLDYTDRKIDSSYINVLYPPNGLVGASGDGATDDTQALRDIISYVTTLDNKPTLFFPNSQGYYITDTIEIPRGIDVIMDSPLIFGGQHNRPALKIGDNNTHNRNVEMKLQAISKELSNWSNDDYVGIQVVNAYSCNIEIFRVEEFTVGVEFLADNSQGFTMNNVNLNYFRNNKYGVLVSQQNSGWPNANNYYGGLFYRNSNTNVGQTSYSIAIISKDGSYVNINANRFYSPNFESREYNIPILIEGGNDNLIRDIRSEGNNKEKLAVIKNGMRNHITTNLVVNSSSKIETYGERSNNYVNSDDHLIFHSNALGSLLEEEGETTKITSNQIRFVNYNGTFIDTTTAIEKDGSNLVFKSTTTGIGFLLDTSDCKKFRIDFKGGEDFRLRISPYDSEGIKMIEDVPISDDDGWGYNLPIRPSFARRTGNYGGNYIKGQLLSTGTGFEVHPDAEYVKVIISSQISNNPLTYFTVRSMENSRSCVYI